MQTKVYITFLILSALAIGGLLAKPSPTPKCPPNVPIVNCIVDPCRFSKCPGDPTAICIANYCGGCNAVWYKPNGERAQCEVRTKCPPDQPEVACVKDPCQGETCSNYPDAVCVANYCGGCLFDWYKPNGEKVTCDNSI